MTRPQHVYRVAVASLPEGSEQPGWEPPGWHEWCFDHGYAEAPECSEDPEDMLLGNGWGRDHLPFRWPARQHWLSKGAAERCAARFRQWGADARVIGSEPLLWRGELAELRRWAARYAPESPEDRWDRGYSSAARDVLKLLDGGRYNGISVISDAPKEG